MINHRRLGLLLPQKLWVVVVVLIPFPMLFTMPQCDEFHLQELGDALEQMPNLPASQALTERDQPPSRFPPGMPSSATMPAKRTQLPAAPLGREDLLNGLRLKKPYRNPTEKKRPSFDSVVSIWWLMVHRAGLEPATF